MVKDAVSGVIKVAVFLVTFVAYWFCLDEKYYRYMDAKIMADVDAAKKARYGDDAE
ncbi:MAG: hypothetical protein LBR77_07630 [Lachnospiraceae bacterium]|jgi:hypothetical protein|nr:hypothetical protein [Lachnospiraceae bacterium]